MQNIGQQIPLYLVVFHKMIGEDIRNQYIYVVRVIARASVCVNSISELIMI